jgi:hypothetical protein
MLRRSQVPSVGLAALATLAAAACDGAGNTGAWTPPAGLVEAVPWTSGLLPALDGAGHTIVPDVAQYPPVGLGLPDPGSRAADCAGLAGLEFAAWLDDFEPLSPADPNETGVAGGWSSYDDLSKGSFHAPGDATWYPRLKGTIGAAWGLPAERTPGPSCDGRRNDWVMHFRGGLFRKWGGGVSHAFQDPVGKLRMSPYETCMGDPDFCPKALPAGAAVDRAGLPTKATSADDYALGYKQSHDFFDVSRYDGVAFWARRGPEGHDHALVILTDKFTSSRLARENQQFCRRVRECHTRCLSGAPCAPDDPTSSTPIYRCFDPKAAPDGKLASIASAITIDSELDLVYPRCGPSACSSPDTYKDRDFDEKQCRPYSFPAADVSGEYCWNPGDPEPASRDESCQDGWQTSVELTQDWHFYALPWSRFGQVGFGKKAPYMDLASLDTLAFGATMGWADVYFDNVTLYRRKK